MCLLGAIAVAAVQPQESPPESATNSEETSAGNEQGVRGASDAGEDSPAMEEVPHQPDLEDGDGDDHVLPVQVRDYIWWLQFYSNDTARKEMTFKRIILAITTLRVTAQEKNTRTRRNKNKK